MSNLHVGLADTTEVIEDYSTLRDLCALETATSPRKPSERANLLTLETVTCHSVEVQIIKSYLDLL